MDYQSCTKYVRGAFTDRGHGKRLVLSATRSSRKIAKDVKTHIIYTGSYLCMKNKVFVMCVVVHLLRLQI
jgi:hypothetical protein